MARNKLNTEILRRLRADKKLSQAEFASQSGIPLVTIRRIEQGSTANPKTIQSIADFYNLENIDDILDHDDIEKTDNPSDDDRSNYSDYFDLLRTVYSKVHILGLSFTQDGKPLELDQLFVLQNLSDQEIKPTQFPLQEKLAKTVKTVDPRMIKNAGSVIAVLGGPGSGKTTLIRWLILQLIANRRNEWRTTFDDAIPLPLILREMKITDKIKTFDDLLNQLMHTQIGVMAYQNLGLLKQALAEGKAFILIDGYDEINDELRTNLHKIIWQGIRQYKNNRWLLTSRILGYEVAPIEISPRKLFVQRSNINTDRKKYEEYEADNETTEINTTRFFVVPFNDDQVQKFGRNWYLQRETTTKLANDRADDFWSCIKQADDTLRLARIPNLLVLMALIHRNTAELPKGRVDLYERIVQSYTDTIDRQKRIVIVPFSPQEAQIWLSRVAFEMQKKRNEDKNSVDIAREKLIKLVQQSMQEDTQKQAAIGEAEFFVEWVRKRSGLIVDIENNIYTFVHLSFMEFFAAKYLLRKLMRLEDDFLFSLPRDKNWHETIRFAFHIVTKERDHDKHQDLRERLFGVWNNVEGEITEEDDAKLLLFNLAFDSYAWFDLKLNISNDNISLADFVKQKITTLSLRFANITDEGFKAVSRLHNLTTLDLTGTKISDEGFKAVSRLHNLTTLDLSNTNISDERLQALSKLHNLTTLILTGTNISDEGFKALSRLHNLTTLILSHTNISDEGFKALSTLHNLTTLDLFGIKISDEGFKAVSTLHNLTTLYLRGINSISDAAQENLRQALPKLKMYTNDN